MVQLVKPEAREGVVESICRVGAIGYLRKLGKGCMGLYRLLRVYPVVPSQYFSLRTGILARSHTTDTGAHQAKH